MSGSLLRPTVRAGAGKFWHRVFTTVLASIAFSVAVGLITGIGLILAGANSATQDMAMVASGGLVAAQALYGQLVVAAERCRIVGRSAWWCLLLLVPFVGPLWVFADLTLRPIAAPATSS